MSPIMLVAGYVFAVVVGHICVAAVVDQLWTSLNTTPRQSSVVRPGAFLPRVVGLVERGIYLGSIQFGQPQFIGVWLALKVAGQWKRWGEPLEYEGKTIDGRVFYNIFLIGNGLSVAYAAVASKIVSAPKTGYFSALGWVVAILLATAALHCYVKHCQSTDQSMAGT